MALNFDIRSSESRKTSPDFKYSLSAIENVWSNIASTKENLDNVDRRIRNARNLYVDDLTGEYKTERRHGSHKFIRKYGQKKSGHRVKIDPNPRIGYRESDGEEPDSSGNEDHQNHEYKEKFRRYAVPSSDPSVPKRMMAFNEKYETMTKDNIKNDFDYESGNILAMDRSITPKVPKLDSSTDRKSLLSNIKDSGALARIRQQIKQQKENLSFTEMQTLPSRPKHAEEDVVIVSDEKPREPMKRKVASSSHAPSYKGFNVPEAKESIAQASKLAEQQTRKLASHKERKERVGSTYQKGRPASKTDAPEKKNLKKETRKSPSKMQRIVSHRKPVPSITASSWRIGQEAVKKVLETMKETKKQSPSKEEVACQGREPGRSDDIDGVDHMSDEEEESNSREASEKANERKTESIHSDQATSHPTVTSEEKTERISDEGHPDTDDDLDKLSKDLHGNEDLPEEAKSMLADLEMDPSDSEYKTSPQDERKSPTKETAVKIQPAKMRKKRKAPQMKQRNEEEKGSRPKIRHYDQEEIQNYMAKQLAERKKKRLQEKKRQQELKLEQEKKLNELYLKQKSSLRASVSSRQSKIMGSTFTKQNKFDEKGQLHEERHLPETAMKQTMKDDDDIFIESTSHPFRPLDGMGFSSSPPIGESSKRENMNNEDGNETLENEIEDQFRDSLEFDKSEFPGIKNITVKKAGSGSPVQVKSTGLEETRDIRTIARSVESEVKELLEKYKASRPIESNANGSRRVEQKLVNDVSDPSKLSKAERIAAITATASSLRERLAAEADRLANLRMLANKELPPVPPQSFAFASSGKSTEFRGALPGTANLYDQAELNEEIRSKEEAATKIQAVFRGHSTRQGLNWKLPSGKTFGASLKEAKQKSHEIEAYRKEIDSKPAIDSYSSMFDADSDIDLFSDQTTTESLVEEAQKPAKAKQRPKFKSIQDQFSRGKQGKEDQLGTILDRMQKEKGDRYSVINILARRLKEANKERHVIADQTGSKTQEIGDPAKEIEDHLMTHDELYEQDFEDGEYESLSSTIKSDDDQEDEVPTEKRAENVSNAKKDGSLLHSKNIYTEDYEDEEDADKTLTTVQEDLPEDVDASVKIRSYHSDEEHSIKSSSDAMSPARSPASLTEGSVDYEKEPVMSSTLRSVAAVSHDERRRLNDPDASLTTTDTTIEKFSPGTLERKLRAEVNQLETMDDALRQVSDIERVRGVTLAQQETVSLAQILKARQLGYKQELEKLSKDATEQATRNAKEIEQAKAIAAQASESVSKRLAEIRAEAADVVAESTKRLEEVQKEAAKRAEEAAEKVEKAQRMTVDVARESADRYSSDMQTMATAAASAAASSAVQAAMQVHREQLEKLRNEAMKKVSRSYSHSTVSSSSNHSTESKTLTDSTLDKRKDHSYADDDFEDQTPRKSSIMESRTNDYTISSHYSSVKSPEEMKSALKASVSDTLDKNSHDIVDDSIHEEIEEIKVDDSVLSRSNQVDRETDKHSTPLQEKKKDLKDLEDSLLQHSEIEDQRSEIEDQQLQIDEHITSSITEDEIDDGFRMVLPVMSHRRKSLEREKRLRRGKTLSENGAPLHGSHSPFASEDTFDQFTSEIVRQYIQEEEIKGRHQRALLKLREKALVEKAKAEMAWLEMQKSTLRNKGADDLMPPLNKKQRGLWLKLQSEQNEIRRLKQAYRAASQERRFMMYQQKEITRLKEETEKIWSKLGHDKVTKSRDEKSGKLDADVDRSIMDALSNASVEEVISGSCQTATKSESSSTPSNMEKSSSLSSKAKSFAGSRSLSTKKDSKSSYSTAEVPEDLPSTHEKSESINDVSFPSYSGAEKTLRSSRESQPETSKQDERDEGGNTTDDVSITEHTQSSMIADLKKLKKKASEQYLVKREKILKERRSKFESVLKNQVEMADWQKKIEMEEARLKLDIKKALEKTKVNARSKLVDKSAREGDASESSESTTIKSHTNSAASRTSSTKSIQSKDKSSESETSLIEDIKTASNMTEHIVSEASMGSGSKTKTSTTEIAEEYADDTFDSPPTTKSKSKSLSYYSDNVIAAASTQSPLRRRYSKDSDESKSEEETSLADATSDASDVEKRIQQLEEELLKRRRDLDRIRKRREKDQLRKQEQRLKQELQAVENLIQQENKENLNHDRSLSESNSIIKAPISPKIMSPKVLQPANQHDHLIKKQSRESKSRRDSKEPVKRDHDRSDETRERGNRDAALARQIANKVIEQVKEKTGTEERRSESDSLRSLSEEVNALRKLSGQKSNESSVSKASEIEIEERSKSNHDNDEDSCVVSKSAKENSISESLLKDISSQNDKSKITESLKSRSFAQSESINSNRNSESVATIKSEAKSGRSIIEELSKASLKSSHKDESLAKEYSREDSLHSISESIFSDKSIEEDLDIKSSSYRSSGSAADERKSDIDEDIDDIYKDDFFESPSATLKSVQSKTDRSDVKERMKVDVKDDTSSIKDASERERSTVSSQSKDDVSEEEKISQAMSICDGFAVNDRVIVDGLLQGTIRFIGKVSFSPVAVAGVELDEKVGNTDGTFRNKRYFTCSQDYGLFSPVANIAHLDRKEATVRKGEPVDREYSDTVSEIIEESVKTDIEEDISERSNSVEGQFEKESHRSGSAKSFNEAKDGTEPVLSLKQSSISSAVSAKQGEGDPSKRSYSYNDDFEEEEKSVTDKEISYLDDFEDATPREEKSRVSTRQESLKQESYKESPKGSISEQISINSELDVHVTSAREKPMVHGVPDLQVAKDDARATSPSSLSEVESDVETAPLPPRVDLDQLADSLTEGLLKKLLLESVQVSKTIVRRDKQHDLDDETKPNFPSPSPRDDDRKSRTLSSSSDAKNEESFHEVSEEIKESLSEKSGDTIKRMSGHNSSEDLDLEVSEAFIVPAGNISLEPDETQVTVPVPDSIEKLRDDQNRRPGLVEEVMKRDELKLSPSAANVTENEIGNVSKELMLDAISQMMQIMKTKKAKLAKIEDDHTLTTDDVKEDQTGTAGSEPKAAVHLGDLPKLSTSPPKSPTDFDLEKPRSAIDTDLLAAKLNELKRMDQEIDVLLGEDSDEDEPLSPDDKGALPDEETDMIPPVRVFDFGEPTVHVSNTQNDVKSIVAGAAKIVISSVAFGEDYDDITPEDSFLRSDIDKLDGELENTSKILFKRMIFDVTKDLMKEVEEFRDFQTKAKRPWTKPNGRVFAKFIRQIHSLSGEELIESFQDHICVCLGLKQGRPSLELLKKRLPLNTSKKDYIDALLVEELREEEPKWINYFEDEIRVKEQLTEGILESLISETVGILNEIQSKRKQ